VDDRDRSSVEVDEEVFPSSSRVRDRCATKIAPKLFDTLPANCSPPGNFHFFDAASNSKGRETASDGFYFWKLRHARRDRGC
jgi:hypothetical protein